MIGKGYHRCATCHYDPTGGGPLTEYGRTVAGDFMSTWSRPKEEEAFYGLLSIAPLGLSGDFRYLTHHYEDDTVTLDQRFPMQRELSLTLDASRNISAVMSCGYYGFEPKDMECRRYFAQAKVGAVNFRVGRFLPAFGMNIPDHTKSIKALFGQGKESLNVEASLTHRYFEVTATRILGGDASISTGTKPTVSVGDERDGYSFKGSLFLARGLQLSASLADIEDGEVIDRYTAYSVFWGGDRLAAFYEIQSYPDESQRSYGSLGVRPFKGFWVKTEYNQIEGQDPEVFGTLDFYPRPHFQFTASASKKNLIFVSHYYL